MKFGKWLGYSLTLIMGVLIFSHPNKLSYIINISLKLFTETMLCPLLDPKQERFFFPLVSHSRKCKTARNRYFDIHNIQLRGKAQSISTRFKNVNLEKAKKPNLNGFKCNDISK